MTNSEKNHESIMIKNSRYILTGLVFILVILLSYAAKQKILFTITLTLFTIMAVLHIRKYNFRKKLVNLNSDEFKKKFPNGSKIYVREHKRRGIDYFSCHAYSSDNKFLLGEKISIVKSGDTTHDSTYRVEYEDGFVFLKKIN